ncbi:amidohydrolase family protein [Rhodohalobacter sulfatireducens]|uniref:Amidohydrolase family protein n=1 Tax=Rhodohalobacter sulfatireducens TaxID=2911366 RepID=A0ABS9KIP6_9BACT|nr:amidohydrolase family protein [Rhodohalobacter sulfatireducens]MCG2590662.1 amidohydrolase family protein [Rhodohalobacter sulfatireducens]
MKVFDFNFHLPFKSEKLGNRLQEDLTMGLKDFMEGFHVHRDVHNKSADGLNLMLFNRRNIREDGDLTLKEVIRELRNEKENLIFTKLIDFRDSEVFDFLEYIQEAGVSFIKFHSYQQQIGPEDFERCLKVSEYAEQLGIAICIDTSFGTTGLYKYDNLVLSAQICEKIDDVPVVLLHSGGPRAIDAMLIADLVPNVYLDTSLTIAYYEGSRIWEDLAFSYKKLGSHRILYGSDFPYVDVDKSMETHTDFFDAYDFSPREIENILFNNTAELVNNLNR